ncbi:MAG TPA: hypothetical protein VKY24_19830 [Reyranella sp.]|nr:hypothetical protein [Reyranella sp.]
MRRPNSLEDMVFPRENDRLFSAAIVAPRLWLSTARLGSGRARWSRISMLAKGCAKRGLAEVDVNPVDRQQLT